MASFFVLPDGTGKLFDYTHFLSYLLNCQICFCRKDFLSFFNNSKKYVYIFRSDTLGDMGLRVQKHIKCQTFLLRRPFP